MKKYSRLICFCLFCSALTFIPGCTSTMLVKVWKDPSLEAPVNHVLVVGMRRDQVRRRLWEDAFVNELNKHGVTAVASYHSFPEAIPDTSQINKIVTDEHFDAVLAMHSLPKQVSTTNVPGYVEIEPIWGYHPWRWWYFNYWEDVIYPPHVDTTTIYRYQVDVLMPEEKRGQLIWTGTIRTTEPSTMEGLQREVANDVVNKLTEQKVIPRG